MHCEGKLKLRSHHTSYCLIKVITKLPNSEQSYKRKVQTHNYINRQNQSTTGKLIEVVTKTGLTVPGIYIGLIQWKQT